MFYVNFFGQYPMGWVPYYYQEGDTLNSIARKFNSTVEGILAINPGLSPLNLHSGLQIRVPPRQPQVPTCPIGTSPYEVKKGDTLASIARTFNTTVQAIISANPNINPNALQVGQRICVTQKQLQPTSCPTLNTYVVRQGDTFSAIARAFDITIQQLQQANPGIKPNSIYNGLVLCLPTVPSAYRIVIRIAPKILDLYREGKFVKSYRVATGKPSTPTPIGTFTIVNKQVNPGGPFGTRWMGLSEPHYGIHGTNNPASIGTAASNGCIRMHNKDVEDLFNIVPTGTVVRIF